MQQLLIYIIKWALCLAILYIPFTLLMRKETFHSFKRCLLLFSILVSALLPFAVITIPVEVEITQQIDTLSYNIFTQEATKTKIATKSTSYNIWSIISCIYITGVILSTGSIIINIIKIRKAIKNGTLWTDKNNNYTLHCHANSTPAFSWFNNIVISENDYRECGEGIIAHEEGHVKQKHSWDIIFVEIVKAIQWFNPFIYMLLNDLKEIHEYQADNYALQKNCDARTYQLLILKKAIGESKLSIANSFGRSNVRKRVEMMIRRKSHNIRVYKGAYVIPAITIPLMLFAKPEYIYCKKQPESTSVINRTKTKTEEKKTVKITLPAEEVVHTQTTAESEATTQQSKITTEDKKIANANIVSCDTISNDTLPLPTPSTAKSTMVKPTEKEYFAAEIIVGRNRLDPQDYNCDGYKCNIILEFQINERGEIAGTNATACNVSMHNCKEAKKSLPRLREEAVKAATEYIYSRKWQPMSNIEEDVAAHCTAHIALRSGEREATAIIDKQRESFWIGTTPVR